MVWRVFFRPYANQASYAQGAKMDNMALLFTGIAVAILLEVAGYAAFKFYKEKQEKRLSRQNSPVLYECLSQVEEYLLAAEAKLAAIEIKSDEKDWAEDGFDETGLSMIEGVRQAKSYQRALIAEFSQKMDVSRKPEMERNNEGTPREILRAYTKDASHWAYEILPDLADRVRAEGNRKAAKQLSLFGEVETCHAGFLSELEEQPELTEIEASLCPSCGIIHFGRRPAFCLVCSNPGFEMIALHPDNQ